MAQFILTMLVTLSMVAVGFMVWRLLERQEERHESMSKRQRDLPQDIDRDDTN